MTKTSAFVRRLCAAAAGAAVLMAASSASAEPMDCGSHAFWAKAFPWLSDRTRCIPVYQGDYMVDRGPVYSGPALIAPQSTYAPSRTADGYPYVYSRWSARPLVYSQPISYRSGERAAPERKIKTSVPESAPDVDRGRAGERIYGPIAEPLR